MDFSWTCCFRCKPPTNSTSNTRTATLMQSFLIRKKCSSIWTPSKIRSALSWHSSWCVASSWTVPSSWHRWSKRHRRIGLPHRWIAKAVQMTSKRGRHWRESTHQNSVAFRKSWSRWNPSWKYSSCRSWKRTYSVSKIQSGSRRSLNSVSSSSSWRQWQMA